MEISRHGDSLSPEQFAEFYAAVHQGKSPFQWQMRLAQLACEGRWPEQIDLPTSSGKSSIVEIAVFALACQMSQLPAGDFSLTTPRRIFFVVDRRIIVNEVYLRARQLAEKLLEASSDADNHSAILKTVAQWLQVVAGTTKAPPLDAFELRGGVYRDDAWVRSPTQPTVLATTVDQIGSRMLFRGYGVSDRNLPIHAALVANDALIILDEGHLSRPFTQTVQAIRRYREPVWSRRPIPTPFQFVQMSATLSGETNGNQPVAPPFRLTSEDYEKDPLLQQRHDAPKPASLHLVEKAKASKLVPEMAASLAEQATRLAKDGTRNRIAVVVNRVNIAIATYQRLKKEFGNDRVELMVGRMRPIDRDQLTERLLRRFGSGSKEPLSEPHFVVSTQCLEVGADLDFDGMVCQCAGLSALRQRFGRLDRLGKYGGNAKAAIVAAIGYIAAADAEETEKNADPIYGHGLTRTWHWLNRVATLAQPAPTPSSQPEAVDNEATESESESESEPENESERGLRTVDFGILAMNQLIDSSEVSLDQLSAPQVNAAVLTPASMDRFAQTSPRPAIDPGPENWLHGRRDPQREVRVLWRADLPWIDLDNPFHRELDAEQMNAAWIGAVETCPPTVGECLSVPIGTMRKWLAGKNVSQDFGDVDGESVQEEEVERSDRSRLRRVLLWRGTSNESFADQNKEFSAGKRVTGCVDGRRTDLLRPDDVVVIPVELGGWDELGFLPDAPSGKKVESLLKLAPTDIQKLFLQHNKVSGIDDADSANWDIQDHAAIRQMDASDLSFVQNRARKRMRVHPLLLPDEEDRKLFAHVLKYIRDGKRDASLLPSHVREKLSEEVDDASQLLPDNAVVERYQGSTETFVPAVTILWPREDSGKRASVLPIPSFGDDEDLTRTGRLSLIQHLADVHHATRLLCRHLGLDESLTHTLLNAAQYHDVGKADPRFQALLSGRPLSIASMQRNLYAKSDGRTGYRDHLLPQNFRHEAVSLSLIENDAFSLDESQRDTLLHLIASHHGFARPFLPPCVDDAPTSIALTGLGDQVITSQQRQRWTPPHHLGSGVGDRFWKQLRQFGWYGQALLESILRLSDWWASGNPNGGDPNTLNFLSGNLDDQSESASTATSPTSGSEIPLPGLDAANPLAFVSAIGLFRFLSDVEKPGDDEAFHWRMSWRELEGGCRPVLHTSVSNFAEDDLLDLLDRLLENDPATHTVASFVRQHETLRKDKKLPAEAVERQIRNQFQSASSSASPDDRHLVDVMSCFISDVGDPGDASQLRTARADYFPGVMEKLILETDRDHLRRSLFKRWDYSDPIAGITLHLEPSEDRRHAYQWHMPSGDPTNRSSGGMIGANRLAIEAWPVFQSVLGNRGDLRTIGFRGTKANNTWFTWAAWEKPLEIATAQCVLGLPQLQQKDGIDSNLEELGIIQIYCCQRILRGKTPNLTPAVSVPF